MEGQSEGNALNDKSVRLKTNKIFLKIPKGKLRNHNNNESEQEFRDPAKRQSKGNPHWLKQNEGNPRRFQDFFWNFQNYFSFAH